jgi:hypothetical protein
MVVAYIEIERDHDWKGKGNINIVPKKEYYAILHGYGAGERSVFKVNTSQENIDKVKASHTDVKIYTTNKQMQIRGLEIRPGTPTSKEVDNLVTNLKKDFNIDLATETNTTAAKSWESYLKQDCEHIGKNKIKCTNCGIIKDISANKSADPGKCTNCEMDLNKVGKYHSHPFDIGNWANPTVTP